MIESASQVVGSQVLVQGLVPCVSVVLFSSTSSVWSQPGSSHYSAANTYLDNTAQNMQNFGSHALAVQYGPFAQVGMACKHVDALSNIGMQSLRPQEVKASYNRNQVQFCHSIEQSPYGSILHS